MAAKKRKGRENIDPVLTTDEHGYGRVEQEEIEGTGGGGLAAKRRKRRKNRTGGRETEDRRRTTDDGFCHRDHGARTWRKPETGGMSK